MVYRTSGVCASQIDFDIVEEDGRQVVRNVKFTGGCNGNTQGVSALVDGMAAKDVVAKLSGIRCGYKTTSCPDQLAQALKTYI
jgi:uncharacterized protein (TIGR03905 family)